MAIAITLQQFLEAQSVPFEVLEHKRTGCSQRTADATHVPSECLAKGVVVKHKDGYILTIVPASRQVRLAEVGRWLERPVALATEEEASALFRTASTAPFPRSLPPTASLPSSTQAWRGTSTSTSRAAITAPSCT